MNNVYLENVYIILQQIYSRNSVLPNFTRIARVLWSHFSGHSVYM